MEIDSTFVVNAPVDEVWASLMDVDRVAGCVPGAQILNQLSDDAYQVGMRVRLGPMTMQYRGQVEITERDEEARRAVMRGKAKETRGQGTADATVELVLSAEDGATHGTVHADLRLSGRVAAMGQGIIGDVADQIVEQFVGNLEDLLATPAVHERSGATVEEAVETAAAESASGGVQRPPEEVAPRSAPVEQVGGDDRMTSGQVVSGPGAPGGPRPDVEPSAPPHEAAVSGGLQSQPGARVSDRVSAGAERPAGGSALHRPGAADEASLDGLAVAAAVVRSRLSEPWVVLGLLAVVAIVAYRAGRRARASGSLRIEDLERIAEHLDRR